MPTGLQIRAAIYTKRRGLGFLGKSDALAGGVNRVRDATRWGMQTLSPQELADAFIRITGTSNSDAGHVAKVTRIDHTTGDIYFSPDAGAAIVSGCTYELSIGIRPDDMDRARDRALTARTSPWRWKPLSLLTPIEDWTAKATSSETLTPTTLAFPNGYFNESMLVDNGGVADGAVVSESYYVSPGQQYNVFGRVSARAGTARVRARDVTGSQWVSLNNMDELSYRGWRWFNGTFVVPDDCDEIKVHAGAELAAGVTEWAGVGMLSYHDTLYDLQSRVAGQREVAEIAWWDFPLGVQGAPARHEINGVHREANGIGGVQLLFPGSPGGLPVYYRERHRYAALQSDYMSKSDRTTGDAAVTDCKLEYIAAATLIEYLESGPKSKEHKELLTIEYKNLGVADHEYGAEPVFVTSAQQVGGINVMEL